MRDPMRVSLLLLVLTTTPAGSLAHAQNFGHELEQDVRLDWKVAQGRKVGDVFGDVPPADRLYFEISVPSSGAASYRVTVRTLDWRGYGGGGGGGM
jgi:hypothetical protein